jgi:thiamine-monophosphate kinase
VGGNLARGGELSLTTSVYGTCAGAPLLRNAARAGQALFVTGPIGAAALGLRAIEQGHGRGPERERPSPPAPPSVLAPALAAFSRPRARLDVSAQVAAVASACIDVSDGLVQDLAHLCESSGVAARDDLEAIPQFPGMREGCALLGADLHTLVLAGGEDYELLFTADDPTRVPAQLARRIGSIEAGPPGVVVRDRAGRALPLPSGFDHFR